MRLPPLGKRRNPGNVATGAPGLGRASACAPRPRRLDFLPESFCPPPFSPGDAESAEPGMANLWLGAGAGFGVCAPGTELQASVAAQLPAQSKRQRETSISCK